MRGRTKHEKQQQKQQSSTRLYLWRQFNAMNAFIISSHVITRTSLHAWIAGGQLVDNLISNPQKQRGNTKIYGAHIAGFWRRSQKHVVGPSSRPRYFETTRTTGTTGTTIWEPASVRGSRSSESFPKIFRNDSDDWDDRDDYMRTSLKNDPCESWIAVLSSLIAFHNFAVPFCLFV